MPKGPMSEHTKQQLRAYWARIKSDPEFAALQKEQRLRRKHSPEEALAIRMRKELIRQAFNEKSKDGERRAAIRLLMQTGAMDALKKPDTRSILNTGRAPKDDDGLDTVPEPVVKKVLLPPIPGAPVPSDPNEASK